MNDIVQPSGRFRLAAELRRLRDLAGVSGRELARRIDVSQSKISRIESGATIPSLPEVKAWTAALDTPSEITDRLLLLTNIAFTEIQPWREILQEHDHTQDDVQESEVIALKIRAFQPSVVPGLLQTAEYARRVLKMFHAPYEKEDFSAAVAARLHRQELLFEKGRNFEFLITEAALRWRPGPPSLLRAQWDRITSINTLENVSIGLIPFYQQAVTMISHGFTIYDPETHGLYPFVQVEMIHGTATVYDPREVKVYEERWSLLQQMAIYDGQAAQYLASLANEIRPSDD